MSNKNLIGFFIIIAVLFIISAQPIKALSEDFSIEAQKQQLSACSCGLTEDSYTLRNTGSITSTYQIFKSGSASQFSTISESFFSLEPGQSKEIINYINLPCDAKGDFYETINVTTAFGLSKEFDQQLSAGKCTNFDIVPINSVQNSCPCSPVQYEINIRNTGSYDEIFDINVSKYSGYASVSDNSILLRSNENKSVIIYYNLPCEINGAQDLSVEITAEKSQYLAKVPLKLNIGDCYDYSVTSNSQFTVCEGEKATSLVTLENNAGFTNTFDLKTTKNFAAIENNSISLASNQSGATNLVVDVSDLAADNYSFSIISTSEKGNSQKEVQANLVVDKCRDFLMEIAEPEGRKIASKSYTYQVLIQNTGTNAGTFSLALDGPEWMSLSRNSTYIEVGAQGEVDLNADIPADFSGAANARVTVTEDWLADSGRVSFNVDSLENAYLVKMNLDKKAIKYDFSDINVLIKNNGFENAKYRLSIDGPDWMSLSQNEIELAPGEIGTVQIHTAPSNDTPAGKYAVKITATAEGTSIGYSADFTVKLFAMHWYESAYYFVAPLVIAYWVYILIVIAAIVVIILLIIILRKVAKKLKEKKKMKKELEATKIAEEPPVASYKPSFQPFVTPSILPEEMPRFSVPDVMPRKERDWTKFFRIFFLIIVIAGVAALVVFNWGAIGGYYAGLMAHNQTAENENQSAFAPELEINRSTGIEGEGNVVYVRTNGTLEIPVIIKNKAPTKVIYTINNANSSWVKADRSILSLDINESKTLNLLVSTTPDLPDGTYEISLGLNINEQSLQYSEKIELRIDREKPAWMNYIPYIAAGIGIAILLMIIFSLTKKSRFNVKRTSPDIRVERVKEKKHGIFGKIILVIIIIAVIGGAYYYISSLPQEVSGNYDASLDFGKNTNQSILIGIGTNDQIVIPFIFSNGFDSPAYYKIYEPAEWVNATDSSFLLSKGDVKYVNITANPQNKAEPGLYEIAINVKVPSENIDYVKKVVIQLENKSFGSALAENKFFIIGVVIVIVGVLLLFVFKKKKAEKRQFIAEIKQEIEMEKQKRIVPAPKAKMNAKPKAKKSVSKSSRKKK